VPIDVLCTYLRTHHLSGPSPERYDYNTPPPDSPVRDTIVKIFVNHLQPAELWGTRRPRVSGTYALPNPCPTPGDWSHRDFDLDGAHLHNADFSGVYFAGIASFRSTHFSGTTLFRWAHFTRETRFNDSEFTGDASFDGAQFAGNTYFNDSRFGGIQSFPIAHFEGNTSFDRVHFDGETLFSTAKFIGTTTFDNADFSGSADFGSAEFGEGSRTEFTNPRSWHDVNFAWTDAPAAKPPTVFPEAWPPTVKPQLTPYKYPFPQIQRRKSDSTG
jgi:uncharacterized protein YjbI with pentapeptide repeats